MKAFNLLIILISLIPCMMLSNGRNNLVSNDYLSPKTQWYNYKNDTGSYSFSPGSNVIEFAVKSAGLYPWSAAFGCSNVFLEKGFIYRVSFKAKSDVNMKIISQIMQADAPYSAYSGAHRLNVRPEIKTYVFEFTMRNPDDAKATLQFQCGGRTAGTIFLSEVSVIKLYKAKPLIIPKKYPAPFSAEMKRGINFGSILDAPNEGNWSPELREDYFDIIKSKGIFDHIRIPCRWETHSSGEAPYKIDPEWMNRVDWAVSNALKRGFHVVLNMHHNTNFENNPMKEMQKFLSMWKQIAERFRNYPSNLYFEIYNEPGSHLNSKIGTIEIPSIWNEIWPQAYNVIRESNRTRRVIISGPVWASPDSMTMLKIPDYIKADQNIMLQVHFYYPADFCFQGTAGNGFDNAKEIRWRGTKQEKETIISKFNAIDAWRGKIKLWNGEFGCFDIKSVPEDRIAWINFITGECERRGIPWAYWDFSGDQSSLYNYDEKRWDEDVLKAMINH